MDLLLLSLPETPSPPAAAFPFPLTATMETTMTTTLTTTSAPEPSRSAHPALIEAHRAIDAARALDASLSATADKLRAMLGIEPPSPAAIRAGEEMQDLFARMEEN